MPNKPMRLSNIHKYKKLLIIPIIVAAILILWFLIYQLVFNPYRGTTDKHVEPLPLDATLTEKQVLKDMDYTIKTIRSHHPAWLENDNAKVQAVEEAYKNERRKLQEDGTDSYTTLDEWRILSGIINKLHDGHTGVLYKSDSNCYIDDVTQVKKYGVPAEINGNPSDQLLKDFMGLFSYEGDEYARGIFIDIIQNEAYLKLLGVDTTDGVTFTFATPKSKLSLRVSFKRWYRIDETKSGQPIEPDVPCDPRDALTVAKDMICN